MYQPISHQQLVRNYRFDSTESLQYEALGCQLALTYNDPSSHADFVQNLKAITEVLAGRGIETESI